MFVQAFFVLFFRVFTGQLPALLDCARSTCLAGELFLSCALLGVSLAFSELQSETLPVDQVLCGYRFLQKPNKLEEKPIATRKHAGPNVSQVRQVRQIPFLVRMQRK